MVASPCPPSPPPTHTDGCDGILSAACADDWPRWLHAGPLLRCARRLLTPLLCATRLCCQPCPAIARRSTRSSRSQRPALRLHTARCSSASP